MGSSTIDRRMISTGSTKSPQIRNSSALYQSVRTVFFFFGAMTTSSSAGIELFLQYKREKWCPNAKSKNCVSTDSIA